MIKIFAYGSLMNNNDLSRTVPEARNMFPVKLYGYKRVFDLESTYRFDPLTSLPICVLNLEKTSPFDCVNGICFDMDDQSFEDLLEREKAYSLLETTVYDYFGSEQYKSYCFISMNYEKYPYQLESELQLRYLKICVEGCNIYGKNFFDDFVRSTHFFGVEIHKYDELIWSKINEFN
jgi:gamma-glutamylcyclotransferase (GGCT)/AIG2-like uncharacterized protein YtfP